MRYYLVLWLDLIERMKMFDWLCENWIVLIISGVAVIIVIRAIINMSGNGKPWH